MPSFTWRTGKNDRDYRLGHKAGGSGVGAVERFYRFLAGRASALSLARHDYGTGRRVAGAEPHVSLPGTGDESRCLRG